MSQNHTRPQQVRCGNKPSDSQLSSTTKTTWGYVIRTSGRFGDGRLIHLNIVDRHFALLKHASPPQLVVNIMNHCNAGREFNATLCRDHEIWWSLRAIKVGNPVVARNSRDLFHLIRFSSRKGLDVSEKGGIEGY